jgi:adenosine kinase
MILITGSLAYDQIMDFPGKFSDSIDPDKLHILNVSFLVDVLRKGFGGTAGNIAYSLSLLGVKTSIMGLVGEDFTPYRNFLEKNEIGTTYIKEISHFFTSSAYGITDKLDNQIWGFYTGSDSLSEQLTVANIKEKIDFGIIAPHNPKAMLKIAKEYQNKKINYLFDPGMQLPWLNGKDLKEAFKGAKIIIGNDYEVGIMQEKTGIKNLHALSKQDKIIITTLGEKGSEISIKGEKVKIAPAKVKSTLDPAGAGDAYRSGFMAGFMRNFPIEVCGQMGSVASAYTVEMYGTTTHSYSQDEFCRRYTENYHKVLDL